MNVKISSYLSTKNMTKPHEYRCDSNVGLDNVGTATF